jgi:hypothetical protein
MRLCSEKKCKQFKYKMDTQEIIIVNSSAVNLQTISHYGDYIGQW